MKQYKTVTEVCQLTGLTRKHLYYFHHENVVRAVAHANYSVEGNDGYKLYDEQAVEKLLLIALFYQFGLQRNEIRDMMLDPKFDINTIWGKLIIKEILKVSQINRNLSVLQYLERISAENSLTPTELKEILDYLSKHQ